MADLLANEVEVCRGAILRASQALGDAYLYWELPITDAVRTDVRCVLDGVQSEIAVLRALDVNDRHGDVELVLTAYEDLMSR